VRGQILSIPDGRQPLLNRLYLACGSLPESGRSDQVVISEPFAEAHGLRVGDELRVIIRGRYERLRVSGMALSPEFVYQVAPTDLLPDYERYAVMWMNRRALGNAFGMDGAFNSVVASVQAGADQRDVIEQMDRLLAPYGGIGAHDREDLISHRMLIEEIAQLEVMTMVLPGVFMGVSAFLLSVLMGRIVTTQRQQIAVIKAFGYSDGDLAHALRAAHRLIVAVGVALGIVFGAWAGDAMAALYAEYFRFPETITRMQGEWWRWPCWSRRLAAGSGHVPGSLCGGAPAAGRGDAPASAGRVSPGWFDRSTGRSLAGPDHTHHAAQCLRHSVKASLTVAGIALSARCCCSVSYQFNRSALVDVAVPQGDEDGCARHLHRADLVGGL
jgi:putative ABC transport system permease protein